MASSAISPPLYMTYPSSFYFAVITPCVSCMHDISALMLRNLVMISNRALCVLAPSTFIDKGVCLLWPSFMTILVVSV